MRDYQVHRFSALYIIGHSASVETAGVADLLGRWSCLVVSGSRPPPRYSPDLFSVALSLTPWLLFVWMYS